MGLWIAECIAHDWTNSHYATSRTAIFFEHNDFIIKHNAMKNGELGNNILNQFLSIMYKCLGSGARELG